MLVPSLLAPTKGRVMDSSEEQLWKAEPPMLVTLSGMVTEVSAEQP